jgi:uncharacterized protein (DUF924 family)
MNTTHLDEIYGFWFGDDATGKIEPRRIEFWMRQNDQTDRIIRERFAGYLPGAAAQGWDVTQLTRQQAMALVVLFDQFPRNIFRTSGEAFAYDHLARDLVTKLIADGTERFTPLERFILGLPFVHHENMDGQDRGVMLAALEAVGANDDDRDGQRFNLDQAIRHREVIQRFGRFPHRNVMLGRQSTSEEIQFLETALRGRGF